MCYFYGLTQIYNTSSSLPPSPSLPHILNCNCCFSISQEQTDTQDTFGGEGVGGVNKQVNERIGGDMEFLINCNIPFPLQSRIMVWFGLHLRPYDPLCIRNLHRKWTYSSPLKTQKLSRNHLCCASDSIKTSKYTILNRKPSLIRCQRLFLLIILTHFLLYLLSKKSASLTCFNQ